VGPVLTTHLNGNICRNLTNGFISRASVICHL
jgi:hypothetical protein